MSKMFHDLMKGLGEVEDYLSVKGVGYRVHVPETAMQVLDEDRKDIQASRSRMKEKGTPLAKVKEPLIASGRLRG